MIVHRPISRSMEKAMKVDTFGHRAQGFDVICSCSQLYFNTGLSSSFLRYYRGASFCFNMYGEIAVGGPLKGVPLFAASQLKM